ncbi:unnamed protein product [Meganyctiphanes norvegica]|uniref:Cyclin-dependent kinase inhibitor domain-containing protein n=1 Tax=Meganyctiphanes norvegica TaxID=48144 RepID=A0AAV2SJM2_MEGNR
MRELCYEEIMTTRVAIPNFIIGCRMSEMRRRLLPSPTPEQQSVKRNLFGPIDHEENIKFVQAELSKITKADAERWNFDFSESKPRDGRFKWEAVGASDVPSAYHLPTLTNINQSTTCVVPSFIRNKVETTPPKASQPSSSSSPSTSAAVDEIIDSVALTTTATTTVVIPQPHRSSSTLSSAPSVPATQQACNKVTVESNKSSDNGPKTHLTNKTSEKLQQTSIKDMFKCKKRSLNGSKVDADEQLPTLVKRQRTSQT